MQVLTGQGQSPFFPPSAPSPGPRPSALAGFTAVVAALAARPAVFLDYDGTLTPIMPRPDQAVLDPGIRGAVVRLAVVCPVSVVSGRDLADVRAMVGIDGLTYAGSHGFDIAGPSLRQQVGEAFLPALDAAAASLTPALAGIAGVLVERKRFAIAVHTRQVAAGDKAAVAAAVQAAAAGAAGAGLRVTGGKEIHEIRPDLPWDKGRAVLRLLDLGGLAGRSLPLFLGDDETDEDGFRAVAGVGGIGIRVGAARGGAPSWAGWSLADPPEVGIFLNRLADHLSAGLTAPEQRP